MTVKDANFEKGVADFFGDAEVAEKYMKLKSIEEKIKLIWTAPVIQKFMKDYSDPDYGKSEGDSRRFRDLGNNLFKVGKDHEAIDMFNKAIMKGPLNEDKRGRDMSLAVANRSAALLRLGHLEAALEDVDLALASGYPKDLRYKLYERRIRLAANLGRSDLALATRSDLILSLADSALDERRRCAVEAEAQQLLERLEAGSYEAELSAVPLGRAQEAARHELGSSHAFLPCLSDKVDIEYHPSRGRFGVANTDIPAGTVVLVEPAVTSVITEESRHRYCDFCCKQIQLRLVPCVRSAEYGFCSEDCRAAAERSYHRHECGNTHTFRRILDNVKREAGTNKMGSTLDFSRLCFRAIARYPLEWYKKNFDSIFEEFPKFGDESWDKSAQHSLLNLVSHEDRIKPGRLWSFLISAVCHVRALQISGYFGSVKEKVTREMTADEALMGRLLVHLLLLMQFNTHAVTEATDKWDTQPRDFDNRTRGVAHGLFPTLCLLNHSCDNNVYKYFAGNTVVVIAHKNIAAGEEVTEEYFPSVQAFPRDHRRVWLMEHYWFDCACQACDKDMPTLQTVSSKYSNFCCPEANCRGLVQDTGVCLACAKEVAVDPIKVEIEQLKGRLELVRAALDTVDSSEDNRRNYEELTTVWRRLQQLVKHPYRLLYKTEQLFWRAIRINYGNMSYRK